MQQAGQVPYLDQNDAHEQSLGQSDGSLPGPEQTLNQSINQSKSIASSIGMAHAYYIRECSSKNSEFIQQASYIPVLQNMLHMPQSKLEF